MEKNGCRDFGLSSPVHLLSGLVKSLPFKNVLIYFYIFFLVLRSSKFSSILDLGFSFIDYPSYLLTLNKTLFWETHVWGRIYCTFVVRINCIPEEEEYYKKGEENYENKKKKKKPYGYKLYLAMIPVFLLKSNLSRRIKPEQSSY